jgi:hypothetical protein
MGLNKDSYVFNITYNFYKEEGSMVCEARIIDKMCSISIYCLTLCSHEQVVLLVLNGLGKLSVDVIRKRMLQDSATLKLF